MAEKVTVGLDLRDHGNGPLPGYTETTASNGLAYYFKYSGGTDGKGNVIVKQGKPAKITVTAGTDPRYRVCGAWVQNDWECDTTGSWSGNQATIEDDAVNLETGMDYIVIIADTVTKTAFSCDPKISNVPD